MPVNKDYLLPNGKEVTITSDFDNMDPLIHIGKRSGAGYYCWDCRRTLCKDGESAIHQIHQAFGRWYNKCPECGARIKKTVPEDEKGNKRTGVSGCCSFNWAQDPKQVKKICRKNLNVLVVANECNEKYTGKEFLALLKNECPIQYTHSIGVHFC